MDRNFIVELYNNIRETETDLSHEIKFHSDRITDEDKGYRKCLIDIGIVIRDYMQQAENKDRFYNINKNQ